MVDELNLAFAVEAREECQLCIDRSSMYQRPPRVVADTAEYRGTKTRRADDGVRFAPQWFQRVLKLEEGGAGMADHLPSFVDQADPCQALRTHDDDLAIIIATVGGRATREAGIGSLHYDDLVRLRAGLQHSPLLNEAARPNNGERRPISESEPRSVTARAFRVRQYVSTTDDRPQLVEEAGVVARPISEQRVDVDSSGRHGSNSLAQSLWLPITQIRAYRWCSPPRIGCAIMSPNRAREIGDVVLAIEAHGPSHDRVKRAVHHEAGNKP